MVKPVRYIEKKVNNGKIKAVVLDNGNYGLELENDDGQVTRASFAQNATLSIVAMFAQLMNGEGSPPPSGWTVAKNHAFVKSSATSATITPLRQEE